MSNLETLSAEVTITQVRTCTRTKTQRTILLEHRLQPHKTIMKRYRVLDTRTFKSYEYRIYESLTTVFLRFNILRCIHSNDIYVLSICLIMLWKTLYVKLLSFFLLKYWYCFFFSAMIRATFVTHAKKNGTKGLESRASNFYPGVQGSNPVEKNFFRGDFFISQP